MAYLDQLDPADRDAFRIFADPTIDPLERERRMMSLGQPAAPDERLAKNEPPQDDATKIKSLLDASSGPIAAGSGGASAPTIVEAPKATGYDPGVVAAIKQSHGGATDIPVSLDEEADAPAGYSMPGPARPQFDLPFASTGGKATPTERVTEQVSARQGTMSPDQRAEHSAALEVSEQAQNDLAVVEAQQAQEAREVDVRRREAEMAQRARLDQIRTEEIEKARDRK